jgi:hypothetical protein
LEVAGAADGAKTSSEVTLGLPMDSPDSATGKRLDAQICNLVVTPICGNP